MVVSFFSMVISVYDIQEFIHIHYFNKEKFAQINIIAKKLSKMMKTCQKCSFRALVGPYTVILF